MAGLFLLQIEIEVQKVTDAGSSVFLLDLRVPRNRKKDLPMKEALRDMRPFLRSKPGAILNYCDQVLNFLKEYTTPQLVSFLKDPEMPPKTMFTGAILWMAVGDKLTRHEKRTGMLPPAFSHSFVGITIDQLQDFRCYRR